MSFYKSCVSTEFRRSETETRTLVEGEERKVTGSATKTTREWYWTKNKGKLKLFNFINYIYFVMLQNIQDISFFFQERSFADNRGSKEYSTGWPWEPH